MKKIYTSDNIKKNLVILQRRYSNMYNKNFSIKQIIYAFNKLPGRYQDLLLKINKDENDKANLLKVYNILKRELMNLKEVPDDIKIIIKNIKEEEAVKKSSVTMEDVETDNGDRWVKPKENKEVKKIIVGNNIDASIKKKEKKEETVIEKQKEEASASIKSKQEKLMILNNKLQQVILEEYKKERKKIDIDSIIENIDMDDDEKFILLVKFENNSVKTNEEVSKELGITTDHIDGVVTNFYERAIKQRNKKIYKLESE